MDWFKHDSSSISSSFVFDLVTKFRGDGYLGYFGTLELMARHFDYDNPGVVTLPFHFVKRTLRISKNKLTEIYEQCGKHGKLDVSYSNDGYVIFVCPDLTKLIPAGSIRLTGEYKKWRTRVLERDSHTCQHCGADNELHVHHMLPIKTHPHLATQTQNGIVLCSDCHKTVHGGMDNE